MIEIRQIEDWNKLKADCLEKKVNLFLAKLSPACPVSHMAEKVLTDWLPSHPQTDFIAARIDVIRARNLSRAIAEEVGIKHESPQVFLLSPDGTPLWESDHFAITSEALQQQFPH